MNIQALLLEASSSSSSSSSSEGRRYDHRNAAVDGVLSNSVIDSLTEDDDNDHENNNAHEDEMVVGRNMNVCSAHHHQETTTTLSSVVDLERILREDDEDDEDDMDMSMVNMHMPPSMDTTMQDMLANNPSTEDNSMVIPRHIIPAPNIRRHRDNEEEGEDDSSWDDDILQAILYQEEDDDDESGGELMDEEDPNHQLLLRTTTTVVVVEQEAEPLVVATATSDDTFATAVEQEEQDPTSRSMDHHRPTQEDIMGEPSFSRQQIAQPQRPVVVISPLDQARTMEEQLVLGKSSSSTTTNHHHHHHNIVSPLQVKRRLKPKFKVDEMAMTNKNIGTTATTTLPWSLGAIQQTSMKGIQQTLQSSTSGSTNHPPTHNKPTCLAMNDKFLAMGCDNGICWVWDWFQRLVATLKHGGDTPFVASQAGAVTSLSFSPDYQHGNVMMFVLAGYTSGYIVVWDVGKQVALRTVLETSVTPSPITALECLNYPSNHAMTTTTNAALQAITVDAAGLVHKLAISKNLLWNSYSVESECLLDGSAGQILDLQLLLEQEPPTPTSSAQSHKNTTSTVTMTPPGLVLLALSSERSSFVVAVAPTVHVLYRWAKPTPAAGQNDTATTTTYLPCLAWAWALVAGGQGSQIPTLARAWGKTIQLLQASFQPHDDDGEAMITKTSKASSSDPTTLAWPAFGMPQEEIPATAPVVALEWLNERSLVYLTMQNEFTVVDTVMRTLVERLDLSPLPLVYAEFSLSRRSTSGGTANTGDGTTTTTTNTTTTFCNSITSRDDRLLILCQDGVQSMTLVGAKRRISQLEQDGEWLEALAFALDHYETTIASQQDRKRMTRKDLLEQQYYSSSTTSRPPRTEDEEWIAKLLVRYIHIAMENAPDVTTDVELATSHFQMLAGVCIDFCVTTKRLDLLFGPIFRRFLSVGSLHIFLNVLEPYILNDKLDYIAPEAMAHFVEHCKKAVHGMATVERCLLHMNVTMMDFDTILTLLQANEMYSALFYIYNQGLKDYISPLEILLEKIFDAADTLSPAKVLSRSRRKDGKLKSDVDRFGYKAILYLQYCFEGRTFPHHAELEDDDQLASMRTQLLKFLLQKEFTPTAIRKPSKVVGLRGQVFPYTQILLMVDPKAMLDTLSLALDGPDSSFGRGASSFESFGGWEVEVGSDRSNHSRQHDKAPDRQEIITMLLSIIMPEHYDSALPSGNGTSPLQQSQAAVDALMDFLAEYLMKGVVRANKEVTLLILKRMTRRFETALDARERLDSQQQILQLLTALPSNSYEPEEVLLLVQKAGVHRAALLLHQEGASTSWRMDDGQESPQQLEHRTYHFRAAIDCYLDDEDPNFSKDVFAYVKKECTGSGNNDSADEGGGDSRSSTYGLRNALASKLVDLVQLDSLMTAELVAELFVENLDDVVLQLHDEQAQFLFFQAIISGELNQKDAVAGAVLNANLTMDHHHRYLALMAKLHPEDVYEYLQTHNNYRSEVCLPLCQKYDIPDASCYLMERMGNVSSGLQLILQTLESRMMGLKRIIRGMGTTDISSSIRKYSSTTANALARFSSQQPLGDTTEREVESVKRILIVALDLCERNSGTSFTSSSLARMATEHGSQLWFNVLDRLINAKGFLRLSKEQSGHAKIMAGVLSDLLRLTMQRMVSSVPLPDLVRKVTSDHSGSRLGELREMVESLLSTYGFELTLFKGAVHVFHHDSRQMQSQHKALRIQGSRVSNVMNVPLSDTSNKLFSSNSEIALKPLLQVGESGNASLIEDVEGRLPSSTISDNGTHVQTAGVGMALSKLQRRRQRVGSAPKSAVGQHRTALNLMPESERMIFVEGQENPDATFWEDRVSGLLGEAEHLGRFRSFLY